MQELSIEAVLSGANCLVLAPTAGGKTEAAFIPVVDVLVRERIEGLGVLYLSPLKALINNQEERLNKLAGMVGKRVFVWHGDVSGSTKKTFLKDPAEILMTTPESLEVLLTAGGPKSLESRAALVRNLRMVVIDEIHAFCGDDRGDHLMALLERLSALAGKDIQRIGLSATVGNPATLLQWLQGTSQRESCLVDPGRQRGRRLIEIHPLSEMESPGLLASQLAHGKKSLLFADSRSRTEELKSSLESHGITALVHHASISKELRLQAEQAFQVGQNCCIVCTSTMELGLDVGDLDLVMQLHAPTTVSALLQRLGRTGRRAGSRGHIAFLTDESWSFLQSCALLSLAMQGWVEPVEPSPRSAHIYLHQMLARVIAEGAPAETDLLDGSRGYPFQDLTRSDRRGILDHLVTEGILARADGTVHLAPLGEKTLSRDNFVAIYSVFETPRALKVVHGRRDIGQIDAWFAQTLKKGGSAFFLGGGAWSIVEVDWDQEIVLVVPSGGGKIPSWMGVPKLLSRRLCEEMRAILISDKPLAFLEGRGARQIELLREDWAERLKGNRLVLERSDDTMTLYTFAGAKVNQVLGQALRRETGIEASINNYFLRCPINFEGSTGERGGWSADWDKTFDALRGDVYTKPEAITDLVRALPRVRQTQYQRWLPPALEVELRARRFLDVEGARELAALPLTVVTRISALE